MAQFVFEIPDEQAARIATAVCSSQGYGPTSIEDATQFTAGYVFKHLARIVIEQEAGAAASAAADQVRSNADDPLAQALLTPMAPQPVPDPGPVGPTGPIAPTGATAYGAAR